MLAHLLPYAVPVSVTVVAVVLGLGLLNMLRAGPADRAQRLMRWRVILQFVAIVIIMATVFFLGK